MSKTVLKLVSQTFEIDKININKLEFNNDLKDSWTTFTPNSVASYTRVLIRIHTTIRNRNRTIYLILENVFASYKENEIELRYSNSKLEFYKNAQNKNDLAEVNKKAVKELKNEIDLLNEMHKNNIQTDVSIETIFKKRELFRLTAIVNFNLNKGEEWKRIND
ncbi:hypothetical protein C4M96_01700 [Mycoplasmopsis pullorum]|uniref:MSC_0621 family F1-like ATPase epsilon subunit n=1 Tax=Mycoplasmopsis pullorum TaxID=48003 RepID=UPI001118CC3F|nr:hypothetical protein [Mycoplasmopsis pullorum]TNK82969.1 hypothetical protein C4M93_03220 [Mycoplasmopsis pullorum]TNK92187.1 hypothetical protein C4M96_01700 [Mycoplasmopsis pullorum]